MIHRSGRMLNRAGPGSTEPFVTPSDSSLRAALSLHRLVFDELIERARIANEEGRPDSAAALASMAADFAARNHIGRHADAGLERLLVDLAQLVPEVDPVESDLDVAHLVGPASTRSVDETAERWSAASGGLCAVVPTFGSASLLERAARVRARVARAALVVVHTEPDDIVAMLALSALEDRPTVVHVNHHEWVFWPGVAIADVVASHEALGSAICIEHRFVPSGRTLLLPPISAEPEIWTREVRSIARRARDITPALLPPPALPMKAEHRDFEVARMLRSAGRADGVLGAYHRHGGAVATADKPELSVVVLGLDPDHTIDCLHNILETWTRPSRPQLVVVDRAGTPEMIEVLGELAGMVRVVEPDDADDVWAVISEGLRWAWGPYAAVVADEAALTDGCWDFALEELDFDRSRDAVEMSSPFGDRIEGVIVRVDAGPGAVEQAFAALPSAETLLRPRRRARLMSIDGNDDFTGGDHR